MERVLFGLKTEGEYMKVIFLDIDGVLNGRRFVPKDDKVGVLIDDTRLDLIKQVVDAIGAKIVLSSSWREHWEKNEIECDDVGKEINKNYSAEEQQNYGAVGIGNRTDGQGTDPCPALCPLLFQ